MSDSIEKIVAEMRECSIGNRHDAAMIDDWADRLASLRQVPDGYVLVPRRLTAENGAKAILSGEFHELIQVPCAECDEDFDCEVCENEGRVTQSVPVSWDTIKCIHRMMADHFASEANPAPPTSGDSEADELIRLLGFDPERFRTEAGFINHSKLRAAIKNPADYEGLMLHTTPGQWVPIKPEGAPYWGIHTAAGETVAGTSSGLCEGDARLICELRNARLIATPAQAGAELTEPAGVLVINGQALRGFTADQMREMYRRAYAELARRGGSDG